MLRPFSEKWLTTEVLGVAKTIQADIRVDPRRAWAQIPLLGDALEDAGCTDEELLFALRCAGSGDRRVMEIFNFIVVAGGRARVASANGYFYSVEEGDWVTPRRAAEIRESERRKKLYPYADPPAAPEA